MKYRTLITITVLLSLFLSAIPARAASTTREVASDVKEPAQIPATFNASLADINNTLPDGHHDNFGGAQNQFFCRAEGWAADPDDRSLHLNIRILSDDVEVAQTVANAYRSDLDAAGVCTDGTCSFSVNLWGLIFPDTDHFITVQAQDAQTGEWSNLYDTPKTLNCFKENFPVEGYHDAWEGSQNSFFCLAEGWVIDHNDPNLDLNVRILSDGVEVAQTIADRYRQDLDEGGVCPGGMCSFKVDLASLISLGVDHSIAVQAQDPQSGEWVDLNNTPKTLNCFEAQAQTFIVNSAADMGDVIPGNGVCETATPGECTLRAAIQEANANPGADTIHFSIPGAGPHTISPSYGFDFISDPVTIDATTQPGFSGTPIVELDGSNAGPDAFGIFIDAGSSTVHGLAINRFALAGIAMYVNGGNIIQGNYIGTDLTGTISLGNGSNGVAITGGSGGNLIGGTTAGTGNLISGNGETGIVIVDPGSNGNRIQGNLIGTDVTGAADLANSAGIIIGAGASDNVVGGTEASARNLISGNIGNGVTIMNVDSTGNLIQGNFIGTDVTGTLSLGNTDDGVVLVSPNNIIGGTTSAARNVISGNQEQGVRLQGSEATGNVVQGNFIGLDRTGTIALGNGTDCCHSGVVLHLGASNNTIGGTTPGAGNVISGNTADGVTIIDTGTIGNVVAGNFIGTDVNGIAELANNGKGVAIFSGATNNLIGGTSSQARNIISGNSDNGVVIYGEGASSNTVQGNYIGTDISGTRTLGNTGYGIFIGSTAADNIIGGLTAGAGNLISGNSEHGIGIFDLGTTGNAIQGNKIGTDLSGESALANSRSGVAIGTGAAGNVVGGLATGAGNIIAFNNESGVLIYEGPENGILSNAIYANTSLGIDLAADGVTRNDLFDLDSGPNNLQNFPILNPVKNTGKGVLIQGALLSTRNTTFRLEFFSNDVCDILGYGEGQTYLGFVNVTTNSTGHVNFKITLPPSLTAGKFVTATATDPANNTSEFSQCVVVNP